MDAFAAVVLAGGAGRRMRHPVKPALPVGGVAMLSRVLAAAAGATRRVVVGTPGLVPLPDDVEVTTEQPPGGGPVAATAAAVALMRSDGDSALVALLAADLPFLSTEAIAALRRGASDEAVDGAVLVDDVGRPQWLCGVWRLGALRRRLSVLEDPTGRAMHELVDGLRVAHVRVGPATPPVWFDCDTEDDLRRAEEWSDGDTG